MTQKGAKMRIEMECMYDGDCGRSLNVLCIHCDDCRVTQISMPDEGVDDWDKILGIEG